jgi:parallel beta-helix repeat protein
MNKQFGAVLVFVLLATVALSASSVVSANFFPPPPELPHAYIRSDGTVGPSTLPIQRNQNNYTLTDNIYNWTLEIQKTNIVLDGAGYRLEGNTSGIGILLNDTDNVVIKNLALEKFRVGVQIENSTGDTVTSVTLVNCENGVLLNYAPNVQITKSQITSCQYAILLYSYSDNNIIKQNLLSYNRNAITCEFPSSYSGTDDNNTITGNTITNNTFGGIVLRGSANNTITNNTITGNQQGIILGGSSCTNNYIAGNQLTANNESNISISGDAKYCTITQNNITQSKIGIDIFNSNNSQIYLNNFLDNQKQVNNGYVVDFDGTIVGRATNFWNYNGKGNFWSDRTSDNATYVIDERNVDHYPLAAPASTELTLGEQTLLLMPQEYLNYTVKEEGGMLWAVVDGCYPMHMTNPNTLPLVYPIPPDTTDIHITLDGLEQAWINYSNVDPTAKHYTIIGEWEMIYCTIKPAAADFVLQIHYQHPIQTINGSNTFLYDLNISPYLSAASPTSTAHFQVGLPQNHTDLNIYRANEWTPVNYTSTNTATGKTITFDVVSKYGEPLEGDVVFVLSGSGVPEFPSWVLSVVAATATIVAAMYARLQVSTHRKVTTVE